MSPEPEYTACSLGLGKRPPEVPYNSVFLHMLRHSLSNTSHSLAPCLPSKPFWKEWGSSSQACKALPIVQPQRVTEWGWQKPGPFSVQKLLFSVTCHLAYSYWAPPVPYFTSAVSPFLPPCSLSTDNVPFTVVVISLLPQKQVPGETFPTPQELSLVTLVSSPQPALNRLPFLHVCPDDCVWTFWSFTWQDVY